MGMPPWLHYWNPPIIVSRMTWSCWTREICWFSVPCRYSQIPDLLPSLALAQVGVCVPSSCGPRDVELALSAGLHNLLRPLGLTASAELPPGACYVKQKKPFSAADIIVMWASWQQRTVTRLGRMKYMQQMMRVMLSCRQSWLSYFLLPSSLSLSWDFNTEKKTALLLIFLKSKIVWRWCVQIRIYKVNMH